MQDTKIITVHPLAPIKPEFGARCNGCGVCCIAEPCPVAHVFLWQFRGRCRALQWQEVERRYVCGMVINPAQLVHLIPTRLAPQFGKWFATRIAAGYGCDSMIDDISEISTSVYDSDPKP